MVARRTDAIIAGGALFVEGSSARVGLMATAPGARRQGAQRALLARRLQLAARAGARLESVETGSPGPLGPGPSYRNILRCGFEAAHERPSLRFPASVS